MAQIHIPGLVCANCCSGIPGQGGTPEAVTIYKGDALCFTCLGRAKGTLVPGLSGGWGGGRGGGGDPGVQTRSA